MYLVKEPQNPESPGSWNRSGLVIANHSSLLLSVQTLCPCSRRSCFCRSFCPHISFLIKDKAWLYPLYKYKYIYMLYIYICVNFSFDIPLFIVRPRFCASNWGPQDIGNHRSSDFPRTFWREVACTYSIWCRTRTSLELNDVSSVLQSFNDFVMFGLWLWLLYGDGYSFNLSMVIVMVLWTKVWSTHPQIMSTTQMTFWGLSSCCLVAS